MPLQLILQTKNSSTPLHFFKEAGPGGLAGGGAWGAATDERRVYTNIANSEAKNFTLAPSNITTTTGGWVAMDASNGKVLWSTANPSNSTANGPVSVNKRCFKDLFISTYIFLKTNVPMP